MGWQVDRESVSRAFALSSQVTTISLEMVIFGLGGVWLDRKLGTSFWGPVGFVAGFGLGLRHLLALVRQSSTRGPSVPSGEGSPGDSSDVHDRDPQV